MQFFTSGLFAEASHESHVGRLGETRRHGPSEYFDSVPLKVVEQVATIRTLELTQTTLFPRE